MPCSAKSLFKKALARCQGRATLSFNPLADHWLQPNTTFLWRAKGSTSLGLWSGNNSTDDHCKTKPAKGIYYCLLFNIYYYFIIIWERVTECVCVCVCGCGCVSVSVFQFNSVEPLTKFSTHQRLWFSPFISPRPLCNRPPLQNASVFSVIN